MIEGIHRDYRYVVFEDESGGLRFISRSTVKTTETTTWDDGNVYPHSKLEISSASHPFYTGKQKLMDTAGRVDRFRKRYGQAAPPAAG